VITVAGINTAIDRMLRLDRLEPGQVQRAQSVQVTPGGKGVHVAQTLAALGETTRLVGLTDAAHHGFLSERMRARGVTFHGVRSAQPLRTCLAVHERDGRTTELLEPGPVLDEAERDALFDEVRTCAAISEAMVFSGSLPGGLDAGSYAGFVRELTPRGCLCVVDASGDALRRAAEAAPFLLKPNRDEASALAGRPVASPREAADLVADLRAAGVRHPVITLGAQGAVGGDAQGIWHAVLALPQARNAVGSGDCFLAGVTAALVRTGDMRHALRLAMACGASNALTEETGWIESDTVHALASRVSLRALGA
jgi:1-phosphofructokinase family hexose kinase